MKKILLLLVLIILTGCSDKYITCSSNTSNEDMKYSYNANYKVYYKGKYVTKIIKEEIYTTELTSTYNYFKNYKKLEYKHLSDVYGGYDYKIDLNRGEIKIKATIDVKELDVEKMIKNDMIDKYYTSKNRIYLSGLKKHYEEKNIICK